MFCGIWFSFAFYISILIECATPAVPHSFHLLNNSGEEGGNGNRSPKAWAGTGCLWGIWWAGSTMILFFQKYMDTLLYYCRSVVCGTSLPPFLVSWKAFLGVLDKLFVQRCFRLHKRMNKPFLLSRVRRLRPGSWTQWGKQWNWSCTQRVRLSTPM